ncbi:MAG: hypothetical protein K2H85_10935, partial [Allobaculum sp.]|nr:hypothetical protein [Allobaculum sp.]
MAISEARKKKLLIRKDNVQARLEMYRLQEEKMLSDAAQMYTLGSRSIQRYQLSLSQIADMIKQLEDELEGIEDELAGVKRRKAVAV